ncbi:MAG: helix-turn-helix domain-containing protein [Devosia marina]|uniref:LexA family protein n=1 Tax=Devosia marina TaxID=2683198 RepID=UPI0032EE93E8
MSCPDHITPDAKSVAEWLVSNHSGQVFDPNNAKQIEDIANVLAEFRAERRQQIVGLTPLQARVLAYLTEEEDRGAIVPSFEDIGRYCAIHTKSSVHRIVHALANRGAIKIEPNRARSIVVMGRAA